MESLNRVHLSGLRAAEATARLGSLSRAAGELQVSIGAVSQRITRLEEALGCRLFDRVARGMVPTETGREVMALLSSGFGQLGAAVDLATRDRSHTLTVSVAPIFGARWLVWRLPRFTERHPDIRVRVDSDSRLLDPNTRPRPCADHPGPECRVFVERLARPHRDGRCDARPRPRVFRRRRRL